MAGSSSSSSSMCGKNVKYLRRLVIRENVRNKISFLSRCVANRVFLIINYLLLFLGFFILLIPTDSLTARLSYIHSTHYTHTHSQPSSIAHQHNFTFFAYSFDDFVLCASTHNAFMEINLNFVCSFRVVCRSYLLKRVNVFRHTSECQCEPETDR